MGRRRDRPVPPPEHTEHDIDRIAAERSQGDEVLRSHQRPSLWSRLFRRHRQASIAEPSRDE